MLPIDPSSLGIIINSWVALPAFFTIKWNGVPAVKVETEEVCVYSLSVPSTCCGPDMVPLVAGAVLVAVVPPPPHPARNRIRSTLLTLQRIRYFMFILLLSRQNAGI